MTDPNFEQFATSEVLSNSNQVVAVIDPRMIVRWISPSAAAYGVEATGQSIVDFIHPEDLERAAQAFDGAAQSEKFRPSLMANTIVTVRLVVGHGWIPFDASGRWVTDDDGNDWLIAILQNVTTRHAADAALQTLARGAGEQEAIAAVIAAARVHGGVRGSQMIWQRGRHQHTAGDLGEDARHALATLGDVRSTELPGDAVTITGSDWGQALPIRAGHERLGTLVIWGIGVAPDRAFVAAVMAPVLDLAALAIQRSRELTELERQATTDEVTGLLNRHAFILALEQTVESGAVIYIDLDEFKSVNDGHGHTIGDRLLSIVSRRLVDAVSNSDLVGRIGGDEFAVMCRRTTPTEIRATGDRIVSALNQTFAIDGTRVVTGASVGIAYSEKPVSGRHLLGQADYALLEAKAQGKGRAVVLASF